MTYKISKAGCYVKESRQSNRPIAFFTRGRKNAAFRTESALICTYTTSTHRSSSTDGKKLYNLNHLRIQSHIYVKPRETHRTLVDAVFAKRFPQKG